MPIQAELAFAESGVNPLHVDPEFAGAACDVSNKEGRGDRRKW